MSDRFDTMMEPRVEELLERAHSKFTLVTLAARRARQINSYYGQLGDGLGTIVPPQVHLHGPQVAVDRLRGDRRRQDRRASPIEHRDEPEAVEGERRPIDGEPIEA